MAGNAPKDHRMMRIWRQCNRRSTHVQDRVCRCLRHVFRREWLWEHIWEKVDLNDRSRETLAFRNRPIARDRGCHDTLNVLRVRVIRKLKKRIVDRLET